MTTDDRRRLRRFAATLGAALAVLAALAAWRGHAFWPVPAGLAAALLATGLVAPRLLGPVEAGWLAFARALGAVTTFILLTLTFLLLITPLGLVLRLRGKGIAKGFEPGRTSYWIPVDADGPASRPDRPY